MIVSQSSDDCREFKKDVAVRQLAHFGGQLVQLPVEFLLRTPIERVIVVVFDLLPQIVDVVHPPLVPFRERRRGFRFRLVRLRRGGGGVRLCGLLAEGRFGRKRFPAFRAPGDCQKSREGQKQNGQFLSHGDSVPPRFFQRGVPGLRLETRELLFYCRWKFISLKELRITWVVRERIEDGGAGNTTTTTVKFDPARQNRNKRYARRGLRQTVTRIDDLDRHLQQILFFHRFCLFSFRTGKFFQPARRRCPSP